MNKIINLIVDKNYQNKRVDVFLSDYKKKISRTKIKNLIKEGCLTVNNLRVYEPSKKLNLRDNVKLEIPESKKAPVRHRRLGLFRVAASELTAACSGA